MEPRKIQEMLRNETIGGLINIWNEKTRLPSKEEDKQKYMPTQ